jgi:peptidoglycan/xylan/chitin deacetylase (PgdA/CDA1 family)
MKRCGMSPALGLVLLAAVVSCSGPRTDPGPSPSKQGAPPAALAGREVPQFVVFASDDNGFSGLPGSGSSGGLDYVTRLFASRRNPAGSGDQRTFDGSPLHYTFFVNTRYITSEGKENPVYVKRAWKAAVDAGHEVGVHTHSHPHGRPFTVEQWEEEIDKCVDHLTRPWDASETPEHPNPASGLGLFRADLLGFRAPFIEPSDNGMAAAHRKGFAYDSSIEEGTQDARGGDFPWPYLFDLGRPDNRPPISRYPGLWEIPLYNFIAPPDDACERYGIPMGFRDRLKRAKDYFDTAKGEITGMDWNLWNEFNMTPAEFVATLKYTLDRHLAGSRCPMTVGIHSELYTEHEGAKSGGPNMAERRAALEEFFAYALGKPEVRLVNTRELLGWLRDPAPLR